MTNYPEGANLITINQTGKLDLKGMKTKHNYEKEVDLDSG